MKPKYLFSKFWIGLTEEYSSITYLYGSEFSEFHAARQNKRDKVGGQDETTIIHSSWFQDSVFINTVFINNRLYGK